MSSNSSTDVPAALAAAVREYRQKGDLGALLDRVKAIVRNAPADVLAPAARAPKAPTRRCDGAMTVRATFLRA
jgi:hypothetical protein